MTGTPATSDDIALLIKEVHGVHNDIVYQSGLIRAVLAAGGVSAPASTGSASAAPVAGVDKYFPVSGPGDAAFPSPEDSRMVRLGDDISGKPFLLDSSGAVHVLIKPTAACPNGYTFNGMPTSGGGSDAPFMQLLVRQGKVFANRGQWQVYNPQGGSMYNATLPNAFATDAAGNTTSAVSASNVVTPPAPAPSAVAPGSSGKVLEVGTGKAYPTFTAAFGAAVAGDTVHVAAGVYKEAPPAILVPLYIKADKGAILDGTGITTLARGKGGLVPCADTIIEGLEMIGFGMTETTAGGTAAIRPDVGCNYLTARDCVLHENQNGIACGDVPVSITIDGGEFYNNGLPPSDDPHAHGFTHNVYASTGTRRLEAKNGWISRDANGGHACKSRSFETVLDGVTLSGGMEAALLDVPNGSTLCTVNNSTLTKVAGAYNHAVVDYATDDASCGNSGMAITNSTLAALCDGPFMLIGGGSRVTVDAATKAKTTGAITANGGTIVGL